MWDVVRVDSPSGVVQHCRTKLAAEKALRQWEAARTAPGVYTIVRADGGGGVCVDCGAPFSAAGRFVVRCVYCAWARRTASEGEGV